jgi:hypothetical protein
LKLIGISLLKPKKKRAGGGGGGVGIARVRSLTTRPLVSSSSKQQQKKPVRGNRVRGFMVAMTRPSGPGSSVKEKVGNNPRTTA